MINYKRTVLPNQVVPIAGATYNLFTDEQGRSIRGNLRGSDKVSLFITSSINLTASSSVQLVCKKNDGTVVEAKTLSLSGVVANTAKTIIIDDSVVEASDYFLMIITAESNSSTYTLNVRVECSGGAGNEEVDWGEIGGQITDQSDLDNQFAKLPLTGVSTPISETKASYTIQTALKLEAKALGTLGNAVTVKAEANTSDNLAVSVTGNALTILLANATGSKNTMTLIAALIVSTPDANAIFNAIVITGATQMTAFTVQSLSGGVNGTAGYLGEVRYDTNGNRWEMKYTTAEVYYWSPDGYPSDNTEYFDCYCDGKLIYKKKLTGTTPSSAGTVAVALSDRVTSVVSMEGMAHTLTLPIGCESNLVVYTFRGNGVNLSLFMGNYTGYYSKPYFLKVKFIKD